MQGVACGVILARRWAGGARADAPSRLGVGRFRRNSSWARGSGSPSEVSPSWHSAIAPTRSSTGLDDRRPARRASFSGSSCSRPCLTAALEGNRDEAIRAGAAVVLDSEIPPLDKLGVAQDVLAEVDRANEVGELPDVERAFDGAAGRR